MSLIAALSPVAHCVAADPAAGSTSWSRFRGPLGTGVSEEKDLPVRFTRDDIAWQTDLPAMGHSSPVVWDRLVFLTGASQKGDTVQRHVICLSRHSGKVLWDRVVSSGSGEQLHKMNSWATPSCATDGERVVAFFGPGGLHCFDLDGNRIWSRHVGDFPGQWGVGASPIFVDDLVIQNCDAEGESFLLAVDRQTGKDVWRTERESKPRGGWSTPILIDAGRRQLVLNGEFGVAAYDPATGQPLWRCRGFNGRGTPAPVWGHGLLYVVNGKSGDVYAVRPGGSGDVTESHMAWHTDRRGGRDLPSPILVGDCLVVINMTGIATGYDAHDGRELWKERLGGNFSGSPVTTGRLAYALTEEGDVLVFKAGEAFELLARNSLGVEGEIFRSSIAVSQNQLLIRSDGRLYCVGPNL